MAKGDHPVRRVLIASVLVITAACWLWISPVALQEESQYFAETGHRVEAPFLAFFQAYGGKAIFGPPVTDQFVDDQLGLLVQYFKTVRLEYTPGSPGAGVRVSPLAVDMGYSSPERLSREQAGADTPFRRYFPVTGHVSEYAFLDFFDRNGAEKVFGNPISEPAYINGRLVQYFQSTRMEWWPERPAGQRVVLTALGELYAYQRVSREMIVSNGADDGSGRVATGPTPASEIAALELIASVKVPAARASDFQTVTVLVRDQSGRPVKRASVDVVVYGSLSTHSYTGYETSEQGVVAVTFPLENEHSGRTIVVGVIATYGSVTADTQTSFIYTVR